jgi:hypothetical protein
MSTTAISRRSARSSNRSTDQRDPLTAPMKWSLWIAGAISWLFISASMLSFSAADWPSHAVAVHNETANNLGGGFGAFIAYWIFHILGPGTWILLAGAACWLVLSAMNRHVDHPLLRSVGMTIAALACSGFHALWFPDGGALPGSPAGLLAHAGVDGLDLRIGAFGTFLVLVGSLLIGLIVALDQWVLALPGRLLSMVRGTEFQLPRLDLAGLLASPGRLIGRRAEEEDEYEDGYEDEEEYEEEEEEESSRARRRTRKNQPRRSFAPRSPSSHFAFPRKIPRPQRTPICCGTNPMTTTSSRRWNFWQNLNRTSHKRRKPVSDVKPNSWNRH